MKTVLSISLILLIALGFMACNSTPETSSMEKSVQTDTSKKTNTIILDVRTPEEWEQDGHANCSVNLPLDKLEGQINDLRKYDRIIVVCRSGSRAGAAKEMLEQAGFKHVENKGPWQNINCN